MPFVVVLNQPYLFETDSQDDAYAFAEQLASEQPGVAFDVLEKVAQSVAAVPEKPVAVAETTLATGEKLARVTPVRL